MKTVLFTILTAMVIAFSTTEAQQTKEFTRRQIDNLIEALRSDNDGVRMQAIYLAGKYEVTESVEELKHVLKNSSKPNEKILVSLALHRIGDLSGMSAVKTLAVSDSNAKVRSRCAILYNDFVKGTVAFIK